MSDIRVRSRLSNRGGGGRYDMDGSAAHAQMAGGGVAAEQAAILAWWTGEIPAAGGQGTVSVGVHRITADTTIPHAGRRGLNFPPGAVMYVDAGVTLTIHAPIKAGRHLHFDGPGRVVLGPRACRRVMPEWFGVVMDGGIADSGPALLRARDALVAGGGGGVLSFSRGRCRSSLAMEGASGITIEGAGASNSPNQGTELYIDPVHAPASGVATGGGDSTLSHAGQAWAPAQWVGYWVFLTGGRGAGQRRRIVASTADQVTVATPWLHNGQVDARPDATTSYRICMPGIALGHDQRHWCVQGLRLAGSPNTGPGLATGDVSSQYHVDQVYVTGFLDGLDLGTSQWHGTLGTVWGDFNRRWGLIGDCSAAGAGGNVVKVGAFFARFNPQGGVYLNGIIDLEGTISADQNGRDGGAVPIPGAPGDAIVLTSVTGTVALTAESNTGHGIDLYDCSITVTRANVDGTLAGKLPYRVRGNPGSAGQITTLVSPRSHGTVGTYALEVGSTWGGWLKLEGSELDKAISDSGRRILVRADAEGIRVLKLAVGESGRVLAGLPGARVQADFGVVPAGGESYKDVAVLNAGAGVWLATPETELESGLVPLPPVYLGAGIVRLRARNVTGGAINNALRWWQLVGLVF